MKKICIITGSRAEFGLLLPVILKINDDTNFELNLVVTGSHLDKRFGNTVDEISKSGIDVFKKIPINLNGDSKADMATATGCAIIEFSRFFENYKPNLLLVLGDRFEIFGACVAAAMIGIPIAHIAGGETTEGAVDEFLRHSITKMSYFHFAESELYRNRIIQLGEDPSRVFNVGSLGVENTKRIVKKSKAELEILLKIRLNKPIVLCTIHSSTQSGEDPLLEVKTLINSLEKLKNILVVFTKANADAGGRAINEYILKNVQLHKDWFLFDSLGVENYLSLLSISSFMIGNSSSGIMEAPALKVPSINIGDRQKGRYSPKSVIHCNASEKDIDSAIKLAMNYNFIDNFDSTFGNGDASTLIIDILREQLDNKILLKKKFYDLN